MPVESGRDISLMWSGFAWKTAGPHVPDGVFITPPEIKEQGKTKKGEQAGRQSGVLIRITGFDRETTDPSAQRIAEVEGNLDAGGAQHFTPFGVSDQ